MCPFLTIVSAKNRAMLVQCVNTEGVKEINLVSTMF